MDKLTWYQMLSFGLFCGLIVFPTLTFSKVDEVLGKAPVDPDVELRAPKSWTVVDVAHPERVDRFNKALQRIELMLDSTPPGSPQHTLWSHKKHELLRQARWHRLEEVAAGR